jgi:hypothetical protein
MHHICTPFKSLDAVRYLNQEKNVWTIRGKTDHSFLLLLELASSLPLPLALPPSASPVSSNSDNSYSLPSRLRYRGWSLVQRLLDIHCLFFCSIVPLQQGLNILPPVKNLRLTLPRSLLLLCVSQCSINGKMVTPLVRKNFIG